MKDLIEALTVFSKYRNERWPTHCSHDLLSITAITKEEVSEEDANKLDDLGFIWMEEDECWGSFKFGSA